MATRKNKCCSNFDPDYLEEVQTNDKYNRVKLVCASCKKYYKYDTSEKNKEILAARRSQIDAIVGDDDFYKTLSLKQRGFLHDVYDVLHPTLAQLNYLKIIVDRHAQVA